MSKRNFELSTNYNLNWKYIDIFSTPYTLKGALDTYSSRNAVYYVSLSTDFIGKCYNISPMIRSYSSAPLDVTLSLISFTTPFDATLGISSQFFSLNWILILHLVGKFFCKDINFYVYFDLALSLFSAFIGGIWTNWLLRYLVVFHREHLVSFNLLKNMSPLIYF